MIKRLLVLFFLISPTIALAQKAVQFGAIRTGSPYQICVYDAGNVCQPFLDLPPTGGGAFVPPGNLPLATSSAFGIVKPDNSTITISNGIISAVGGGGGGFTQGSVLFADASGHLSQDNANLFWDDAALQFGMGTNSPSTLLGPTPGLAMQFSNPNGSAGFAVSNTAPQPSSAFFDLFASTGPNSDVAFIVGGTGADWFSDVGILTTFLDVTTLNIDDSNTGDEIMQAEDGSVVFGHSGPALGSAPFAINLASNLNLTVSDDSGDVALSAIDDSLGTPENLKINSAVLKFNGPWTANGSVATAMSSLGPTGSHSTVQEWFTVTDSGGNVRYIPAF